MPIPKYAVLVGRAVDRRFATTKSNHYEIKISSAGQTYRIAVNVQSADGSEVLYAMRDHFQQPMLAQLAALADGHHPLASAAGGLALDYVRGEQLTPADFVALPATTPGDDNDLNDRVECDARGRLGFEDAPYPQRQRLLEALAAAQSVATHRVAAEAQAAGQSGKQIGELIHQARVTAVSQSPGFAAGEAV